MDLLYWRQITIILTQFSAFGIGAPRSAHHWCSTVSRYKQNHFSLYSDVKSNNIIQKKAFGFDCIQNSILAPVKCYNTHFNKDFLWLSFNARSDWFLKCWNGRLCFWRPDFDIRRLNLIIAFHLKYAIFSIDQRKNWIVLPSTF